jgi:predicted exporter
LWIAAALLAIAVLVGRLQFSYDLSAFLPQQASLADQILVEQLRRGPGSRLIVIGLSGLAEDVLAENSDLLKAALNSNEAFVTVLNGQVGDAELSPPPPIDSHYLLMRDLDYSLEGLRQALRMRLRDMVFGGGEMLLELTARDPYLATLEILQGLAPAAINNGLWIAADGSAVLLAETRATATELAAQEQAIHAVRDAFQGLPGAANMHLQLTGVAAFSLELRDTIRNEAVKRSVLATVAMLIVLLVFFRRPRFLLLAALPVGAGFLAGLTVNSLLFETVHGVTLAFGFTLLGVAIDYPLHFFSHTLVDSPARAIQRIWPTMRLGAASTVLAYLALTFGGSEGLAQLGLFTATGLIVAALVTKTWLPYLSFRTEEQKVIDADQLAPRLRYWPACALLVAALAIVTAISAGNIWDDRLSSLSPVPANRLATDQTLRAATATPDLRYQLILQANSLEDLLQRSEELNTALSTAATDGALGGWQSVSDLLPSIASQTRRAQQIPDEQQLRKRLASALDGTPFRSDAFEPFVRNALASAERPPLTIDAVRDSVFRSWVDSRLIEIDGRWVAMVSLVDPQPEQLRAHDEVTGSGAVLVDLQTSASGLMQDYRGRVLKTTMIAAILIMILLWSARGNPGPAVWTGLSVGSALVMTVVVVALVHGSLTVIHLVALLLVLGLGLDYALFLSRHESGTEGYASRRGVMASAVSTIAAFGILAGSSIPVLKFLGLTIAAGSALSFAITWIGSQGFSTRHS